LASNYYIKKKPGIRRKRRRRRRREGKGDVEVSGGAGGGGGGIDFLSSKEQLLSPWSGRSSTEPEMAASSSSRTELCPEQLV